MKEHRIPITCIHDTFNLICPICGNVWYNDTKIKDLVECTRCGIEIELTRNGNACRLTMILQGARCTAQNSLYMMLSAMITRGLMISYYARNVRNAITMSTGPPNNRKRRRH